jgi:aminopeptidase-like protein
MSLGKLQEHLYSLPDQPDVIPYVTSYYKERFGFCMPHNERMALKDGDYRVYVDSELKDGHLTYGEIIIPGESNEEVFFSSYICHPSMANNELSGPCVAVHLAKWIASQPRRYTYRIVFIPETIGSITYLSKNLEHMKNVTIAGFNLTCLGDPGHFSYIASRYGSTLADKAAISVLRYLDPQYKTYSFLRRGSDERQYCAPGVDLPVCCICRTKFGDYEEYHTSADNMDYITPEALEGSFDLIRAIVEALEANHRYRTLITCEPQLSPRGLYPDISTKKHSRSAAMMDFIAYCDGSNDIFDISKIINAPVSELIALAKKLLETNIIGYD